MTSHSTAVRGQQSRESELHLLGEKNRVRDGVRFAQITLLFEGKLEASPSPVTLKLKLKKKTCDYSQTKISRFASASTHTDV
jgi:hypothetical protein